MNRQYYIEVLVNKLWTKLRPTNMPPYTFETEEAALRTLRMCYPDQYRFEPLGTTVRVVFE